MPDGPQPRNPWTPVLMTLTLLAMLALGAFGGCTVGFIGAMGLGQFETWPLTVGICAGVVLALVGWWLIWRKRP